MNLTPRLSCESRCEGGKARELWATRALPTPLVFAMVSIPKPANRRRSFSTTPAAGIGENGESGRGRLLLRYSDVDIESVTRALNFELQVIHRLSGIGFFPMETLQVLGILFKPSLQVLALFFEAIGFRRQGVGELAGAMRRLGHFGFEDFDLRALLRDIGGNEFRLDGDLSRFQFGERLAVGGFDGLRDLRRQAIPLLRDRR